MTRAARPADALGQTAPCSQFLTGVVAIAAGSHHGLVLRSNGTVVAWGANIDGQLGNGSNTNSNTPVQVSGLGAVTAIAAGNFHSLAALSDGTPRGWGGNSSGQLGNGTTTPSTTPVRVCSFGQTAPYSSFLDNVMAIAGGDTHSLAIVRSSADLAVSKGASPEPARRNRNLTSDGAQQRAL
ncbi:RCC1 domain-containing protein [Streptomyces sp. NPDC001709]